MKRKFFVILIALMLVCLCGCGPKEEASQSSSPFKVTMPTDNSVNGYRTESKNSSSENKNESQDEVIYYANIKTKKIHLKGCSYAENSDKANIYITENKQELIDMGYSSCKRCEP